MYTYTHIHIHMCIHIYIYIYTYVYIYIHTHTHTHMCVYIYIYRERERAIYTPLCDRQHHGVASATPSLEEPQFPIVKVHICIDKIDTWTEIMRTVQKESKEASPLGRIHSKTTQHGSIRTSALGRRPRPGSGTWVQGFGVLGIKEGELVGSKLSLTIPERSLVMQNLVVENWFGPMYTLTILTLA